MSRILTHLLECLEIEVGDTVEIVQDFALNKTGQQGVITANHTKDEDDWWDYLVLLDGATQSLCYMKDELKLIKKGK